MGKEMQEGKNSGPKISSHSSLAEECFASLEKTPNHGEWLPVSADNADLDQPSGLFIYQAATCVLLQQGKADFRFAGSVPPVLNPKLYKVQMTIFSLMSQKLPITQIYKQQQQQTQSIFCPSHSIT